MPTRRRPLLPALLLALALATGLAAVPGTARAGAAADAAFARSTNRIRAAHGLRPLRTDPVLTRLARAHARNMAARQRLYHTDLSRSVRRWVWLGQNVGYIGRGGSVEALQRAFMRSPPHRANLLYRGANRIGVGTWRDRRGTLWVAVDLERTPRR
jgi:uncharacterized protein YkwD